MANKLHEGGETRIVDAFHAVDLGAPFKVVLTDCVTAQFDRNGEMVNYTIPDFEGLVRSVVMARLAHDRKLNGAELKFLRKAVGVSQADLARILDFKTEHLSKVENGHVPLTTMAERWARVFLFEEAAKLHKMEEGELKSKLHDLLRKMFDGMKPVAAFSPEELEFIFHRESAALDEAAAANDDWQEAGSGISGLGKWSAVDELEAACG
ncbi:helix-turn-helix domain-containing protein [Sphingomonas nostoxanthinifaciens]|uniref:helix-turn-helix domain-containing protein n=1 Tax=Sphingomonas nostoxanthinifaciens TaxID=2872652 RepID=UPI001CC1C5C1|nr:helix-turn-helix transcriptional regulator [Sphingomonas nostoxanthinifaciens]UAK25885.1 helix-turn-helix domain-containing protein [Sphingomonas nostoxanthinifaciens]